jgi:general stress protein YciG
MAQRENPHAVALRKLAGSKPGKARAANLTAKQLSAIGRKGGKAGGKLGGKARAAALTPEKRKEIAQKAAAARWGNRVK